MDRIELKKRRWRLLPLRIKLIFFLVVLPLFFLGIFSWAVTDDPAPLTTITWIGGMIAYGVFEVLCYDWYNKNGLL